MDDELYEVIMDCRPDDWPERDLVDLDDFGDPGAVLSKDAEGGTWRYLIGLRDDEFAEECAHALAATMIEMRWEYTGFSWPNQLEVSFDEAVEMMQPEFLAFLRHWRQAVLKALAEGNPD